jgi:hypothetical protein
MSVTEDQRVASRPASQPAAEPACCGDGVDQILLPAQQLAAGRHRQLGGLACNGDDEVALLQQLAAHGQAQATRGAGDDAEVFAHARTVSTIRVSRPAERGGCPWPLHLAAAAAPCVS